MNCSKVFWYKSNLQQGSREVGDDKEKCGDGVSGLEEGDGDREEQVAGDHQEQQDPEARQWG